MPECTDEIWHVFVPDIGPGIVFNAFNDVVNFTLPEVKDSAEWTCLVDTNMPFRDDLPTFTPGDVYTVTGRSLLLFSKNAKGETAQVLESLSQTLTEE